MTSDVLLKSRLFVLLHVWNIWTKASQMLFVFTLIFIFISTFKDVNKSFIVIVSLSLCVCVCVCVCGYLCCFLSRKLSSEWAFPQQSCKFIWVILSVTVFNQSFTAIYLFMFLFILIVVYLIQQYTHRLFWYIVIYFPWDQHSMCWPCMWWAYLTVNCSCWQVL